MRNGQKIKRITFEDIPNGGSSISSENGIQLEWSVCEVVGPWVNAVKDGKIIESFNPRYILAIEWQI